MKSSRVFVSLCIASIAQACTPGAVQDITLAPAPVEGDSFLTLDQLLPFMDGLDPNSLDMETLGQIGTCQRQWDTVGD